MAASGPVHWEYTGHGGQHHWGELSADYTACVDGSAQSPIDIRDPRLADLVDIVFDWAPGAAVVANNGHTIQVNFAGAAGSVSIDGKRFDLLQFHFHRPSEHTVDGKTFAMEYHFVHKAADGQLAVVGVLVEEGAENAGLQPVFASMPAEAGASAQLATVLDPSALLPGDLRTYRYAGSLTTPPCSEGVRWNLVKAPVTVSAAQVESFKKLYFFNARYPQPQNGREVYLDTTGGE
jgi:carbonic anhydrase